MECKMNFKTDMADERVDEYKKVHNLSDIDGISVSKDDSLEFASVVIVEVLNENGKNVIDKDIGKYITIECKDINYLEEDERSKLSNKIKDIILSLLDKKEASLMVVGLGNSKVTPDALGSEVTSKLDITRHLIKFASNLVENGVREISSICPGVLGTTGIETSEIVESVVSKVKPDALIVIDSLLSQSMDRLGKTIQITDRGIVPGAGVENARAGIKEDTIGIPVIAIGAPLVVESSTIVMESANLIIEKLKKEDDQNNSYLDKLSNIYNEDKIKEILNVKDYNMIVVPKDIDQLIVNVGDVIASSINLLR